MTKSLVWLRDQIKTPPLSRAARVKAGVLLRSLQEGVALTLPASRPMPSIGSRCHELRVSDEGSAWRIVYRTDVDAIVIAAVFRKTTRTTPPAIIAECRKRLREYDRLTHEEG